ncbi:hypothetical protein pdam_00015428, partial [Pocillopora damicornis]
MVLTCVWYRQSAADTPLALRARASKPFQVSDGVMHHECTRCTYTLYYKQKMPTLRKTQRSRLKFGQLGLKKKGFSQDKSKPLVVKLEKFFTKTRKKDDLDYKPDSLQDREFANSSKVHKGKAPFHHEGCNKCPHASLALTNEGEEMLWSKGLLRGPIMEFSDRNYVHFELQGCQEHHCMFLEDFSFTQDNNGVNINKMYGFFRMSNPSSGPSVMVATSNKVIKMPGPANKSNLYPDRPCP